MNGLDYGPLLKQYKEMDTDSERLSCICTMFEMLVTNHLPHIERNQRFMRKAMWIMGSFVLLELLLPDQISLTALFELLAKVFV